jgi:hypothetical protein
MHSGGRMSVLVIRAWQEGQAGAEALRARLIADADGRAGEGAECVAAGIDGILEKVREWLEELA